MRITSIQVRSSVEVDKSLLPETGQSISFHLLASLNDGLEKFQTTSSASIISSGATMTSVSFNTPKDVG